MTKLAFVLAVALSFATGCKQKGGDCAAAINHSMELATTDMKKKMPGMDDKLVGTLKDLGVQHCKDDKWPEEAIKCMDDAKTEADAQACYTKLSKEQQDKMNSAMMETMMKAAGAGPAAAGAAPAPAAGSAAPTAGSAAPAAGGSSAPAGPGSAHQ